MNALRGIQDVSARGVEWEISQDLEKHQNKSHANAVLLDSRAMVASSDVAQTSVDSRIQDFLQAKSVIANLPVTRFSGLTGELKIPVGTSASGFTALQTDGTTQASETDITFLQEHYLHKIRRCCSIKLWFVTDRYSRHGELC